MSDLLAHPRDDGYSLAEMLVTIIVFTLVAGAIGTVVVSGLRHQTSIQNRDNALAQTRTVLEHVDRDIRSANPLCTANSTDLVMEETTPTARVVEYKVNTSGTSLMYNVYAGLSTCPATLPSATTTKTLITNLVNTASMFSVPSSLSLLCQAIAAAPAVPPAAAATIKALTVTLNAKPSPLKTAVSISDCGTELRNTT